MKRRKMRVGGRLSRVLHLLRDGREHSTRDIITGAHVAAVNSAVSELRLLYGYNIGCRQDSGMEHGRRVRRWLYRLVTVRRRATRVELPATATRRACVLIYA